jgi:hypothetical protein
MASPVPSWLPMLLSTAERQQLVSLGSSTFVFSKNLAAKLHILCKFAAFFCKINAFIH